MTAMIPFFKWAQDKEHIYLSIEVPGIVEDKVDITPSTFSFTGHLGKDKYAVNFQFNKTVNDKSTKVSKHRLIEYLFTKDDASLGFWPTLLSNADKDRLKSKCKVDFDKWVDEDDDKKLTDNLDASRFGGMDMDDDMGMGGMGMPGMGGMGMPGMGGMGMPGMGGMGGGPDMAKMMEMLKNMKGKDGAPGDDAAGGDSDDEELPDLQPENEDDKKDKDLNDVD